MYSLLYVDDDEILLGVNKIYLEKNGEYSVDIVSSAREALDRIASGRYDLIISDYQMPEMDGIAFLKEVRSRYGNIPFIIFTGKGREEVVMEALNNGVDFYVQKGVDLKGMMAELRHKINRAIERRRISDELNRSRQEMRDIISFLPDPTFVIDISGRVIAWNQAMEGLTGIRRDEIIGKGEYAYAVPFIGERKPVLIDTVLSDPPALASSGSGPCSTASQRSEDIHSPHVNSGKGAHMWVRAGPICDSEGNVTGAIETIRDMTEIRRIQHDLMMSRDMNLAFANILPVGVYEMDISQHLVFANDLCYEMFGLSRETPEQPLCILNYIAPADRQRAAAQIAEAAKATEASGGHEYRLVRMDGTTFPALIFGTPVINPETKKPVGLRGVIVDLTRRRLQEQALHESTERLKMALEAGGLGLWDVDIRTQIIHDIGNWAKEVMGYDFAGREITVKDATSLVNVADMPILMLAFYRHIEGKVPFFEATFRLRHCDGSWKSVTARGKIIERSPNGKPVRITGTISATPQKPPE